MAPLMETVGNLVEEYEKENFTSIDSDPVEVLKYLMEENGLTQKDMAELGSQGVVSEILNGKRELNIRQIKALGKKFKVSPAVFI
ncbi:DNA-binding helix-turn-helix protein [Leptospira wolffii serovar Khorat str. Khorat-H2]|nr:DNA-binding helix-turn-helix protein [Leptospira wolffii serovar Khorat str. Khorat-H2]